MSTRIQLSLGAAALVLAAVPALAGGAIGWADAVPPFATEGQAVGAAAVILGIIAVGAILMFGITGMITTVVMLAMGGALMANSDAISAALFTGGAGGGSVHDVVLAQAAGQPGQPGQPGQGGQGSQAGQDGQPGQAGQSGRSISRHTGQNGRNGQNGQSDSVGQDGQPGQGGQGGTATSTGQPGQGGQAGLGFSA